MQVTIASPPPEVAFCCRGGDAQMEDVRMKPIRLTTIGILTAGTVLGDVSALAAHSPTTAIPRNNSSLIAPRNIIRATAITTSNYPRRLARSAVPQKLCQTHGLFLPGVYACGRAWCQLTKLAVRMKAP